MKVGAFSCDSRLETKNMMKEFEKKYNLYMYEEMRPMFDPYKYAKKVHQIDSIVKHVVTMEDYQANYQDEFESCDKYFSRLTVDHIISFRVDINVEDIEDDGQDMFSSTYLTKI